MEKFKVKTELIYGIPRHIVYTPDGIRINKVVQTHTFESIENCMVIAIIHGKKHGNDIVVKNEKSVIIYGREYGVEHAEYTSRGGFGGIKLNVKLKALAEIAL